MILKIKSLFNYFNRKELILWFSSLMLIMIFFLLFDQKNNLILIASLIGVTSLIFVAKCNPIGQILMIIFSIFYGYISFTFSYYGEMITYLGMTTPMAILSLISWIKNPFNENKSEVRVNRIGKNEVIFAVILTILVTIVFYYILLAFNTANLIPSTLSISTSFIAVYFSFRRSPYYAIFYAANDIILIILWSWATLHNIAYISVLICFIVFFINDIYGFLNWSKIQRKQEIIMLNNMK